MLYNVAYCVHFKELFLAGCQWLMPVILTIPEAEIKKIGVDSQPGEIVCETLS
jgi:hypothetical protein